MRTVPPRRPWQIEIDADLLICSALAHARRAALGRRLNGSDDDVVRRRTILLDHLLATAGPTEADRLHQLDLLPSDAAATRWQTTIFALHAVDDPVAVELALDVWDALGENEYALRLRIRPVTWRGWAERRVIIGGTMVVLFSSMIGAAAAQEAGRPWWWVPLVAGPVIVAWVLVQHARSVRRRRLIGRAELPHW
jgi:hypothetical protein